MLSDAWYKKIMWSKLVRSGWIFRKCWIFYLIWTIQSQVFHNLTYHLCKWTFCSLINFITKRLSQSIKELLKNNGYSPLLLFHSHIPWEQNTSPMLWDRDLDMIFKIKDQLRIHMWTSKAASFLDQLKNSFQFFIGHASGFP